MRKKTFMYFRLCVYAALIALFTLVPAERFEGFSLCLFYNFFGFRCVTCGMTRAFANAMHLNFARAWAYNKLILVFFPLFWTVVASDVYAFFRRLRGQEVLSIAERVGLSVFPRSLK